MSRELSQCFSPGLLPREVRRGVVMSGSESFVPQYKKASREFDGARGGRCKPLGFDAEYWRIGIRSSGEEKDVDCPLQNTRMPVSAVLQDFCLAIEGQSPVRQQGSIMHQML